MTVTLSVLFAIWLLQVALFHFYKISGILSGIILSLMFGELSLNIISTSSLPPYLLESTIFMALFYLGLTKPNGEFFKKYLWQNRKMVIPTLAVMLIIFVVAIIMNFDLHIAIILVFAFSVVSLSTNSVSLQFMREHNLEKSEIWKIFFAKVISNNFLIVVMFVTLLAIFDGGSDSIFGIATAILKTLIFLIISVAISRYIYPRIAQNIKLLPVIGALLLINASVQAVIAYFIGIHFMIAVFVSTLFIPELYLKVNIIEPIRNSFGKFNNYFTSPILGIIIGLGIHTNILFDRELFLPFLTIILAILIVQYLSNKAIMRFSGLKETEKRILSIGSFAKTDLSVSILVISLYYGLIDNDIFTSSIILLAMLNLLAWHWLKYVEIKSK